jgi:hypothetical protein
VLTLPQEVLRLIRDRLDNLEQVEVLVMLHGAGTEALSADDVAGRLLLEPSVASRALAALASRGLVEATEGPPRRYQYAPEPGLADVVGQLVNVYNTRPVTLIRLIYDRTALSTLADAFRIRKPGG